MKIGINTIFLVPGEGGGIERYTRNLIDAFQHIDRVNDYVLFTNRENSGTFDLAENFKECLVPVSARFRPMKILWEQLILPFQVKSAGVNLLFSPGNISPVFLPCPSVVVMHDLIPFRWPEDFSNRELWALKILFHLTARRVDRIITVSQSSMKQIIDQFGVPSKKVTTIYEACDKAFLEYPPAEEKPKIIAEMGITSDFILYTASMRPHKNVVGLLKAFSRLVHEYALQHLLVIAGTSGSDYLKIVKMAADLRVRERVCFTGYISDDILPALYNAASLFVYSSFYEGFGLPVLEAMACGTPVVASDATSLPEVVGDAGVLVNPDNVEGMADAMYRILSDQDYANELIARGKQRAKALSWEKTGKDVLEVLLKLYASQAHKG